MRWPGRPRAQGTPRAGNRSTQRREPLAPDFRERRPHSEGGQMMEFAFTMGLTGWPAVCLDSPERPPLAARLAAAFDHTRQVWETASLAERKEFWAWLCDGKPQP